MDIFSELSREFKIHTFGNAVTAYMDCPLSDDPKEDHQIVEDWLYALLGGYPNDKVKALPSNSGYYPITV